MVHCITQPLILNISLIELANLVVNLKSKTSIECVLLFMESLNGPEKQNVIYQTVNNAIIPCMSLKINKEHEILYQDSN